MSEVDIAALATRIAALEAGAAAGTTLASFEGGNFGYQMVDATYSARCRFLIPTRTVRINKALLHFSLQPFRSGAASGTSSGTTGNESLLHFHTMSGNTTSDGADHTHNVPGLSVPSVMTPIHNHAVGSTDGRSLTPTFGPAYFDGAGATIGVMMGGVGSTTFHTDSGGAGLTASTTTGTGASGGRSAFHQHGQSGNTSTDSVDHNHSIPGSALSVPNSLYETGMAQGCRVYIDGADVTPTLGGPWGTGVALDVHDLDVSQWLSAKGWHEVQISSTTLGGIFPSLAIFAVVGV